MLSLALTMVSLPGAIMINKWKKGNDQGALGLAWTLVWSLLPTVLVSLAVFFATMERKYLGTFSLRTGKGRSQDFFKNGKDDATRALIFGKTRHYWVGLEDGMERWVKEKWRKWEKEKTGWLTDVVKSRIPVKWIPTEEGRKRESQKRLSMWRRSLFDSVAGNLGRVVPKEGARQE